MSIYYFLLFLFTIITIHYYSLLFYSLLLQLFFFTNRVVNIWNTLPDYVVHADTVNCFKSRLDTFWSNQDLVYNFKAEISGTRSRSEVV